MADAYHPILAISFEPGAGSWRSRKGESRMGTEKETFEVGGHGSGLQITQCGNSTAEGQCTGQPEASKAAKAGDAGESGGSRGGRESGGRGDPSRGSERRKQRRRQSGAPTRSRLHQACLKWLTAGRTVGQSLCIDSVAMRQRRGRGGAGIGAMLGA
jgi:hypothetical protein